MIEATEEGFIDELLANGIKTAKADKEGVTNDYPDDPDVLTGVYAFRGEELVVLMFSDGDPKNMYTMVRSAIKDFSCDYFTLVCETYRFSGDSLINPDTGQAWRVGELQTFVQNHPEDVWRKHISESVMILVCGRNGERRSKFLNYRIADKTVIWGEALEDTNLVHDGIGEKISGWYAETHLHEWAMDNNRRKDFVDNLVASEGRTAEEADEMYLAALDVNAMNELKENFDGRGSAGLACKPDTPRHQVIQHALESTGVFDEELIQPVVDE